MRNIKLTIKYDGTNYAGWQRQKNATSIQQILEEALSKILGEKVHLAGAGRTDAGVHARGQIANFKTCSNMKCSTILRAMNANIPRDIVITGCSEAAPKFHAQFSARQKYYRYTIFNKPYEDPFLRRYAYWIPYKLNIELMKKEARCLVGKHDFRAFQRKDNVERNTVRTIKRLTISRKDGFVHFDMVADGFLYKMVRNIVGSLIEVGRGKFPKGSIKRILLAKNRRLAGPTAPSKGLCLEKVMY